MNEKNISNLLHHPLSWLNKLELRDFNNPLTQEQYMHLYDWYDSFVQSYYELGYNIVLYPEILESSFFQDFKRTCIRILENKEKLAIGHINASLSILNVSFHGNEWYQSCQRRSAFSFYEDLCLDTPLAFQTLLLNTDEWDERLTIIAEVEGGLPENKIPVGIPENHWWWWM